MPPYSVVQGLSLLYLFVISVINPVFGKPLLEAVERTGYHDNIPLPAVVRECMDAVEERGLKSEGIYRISGIKTKMDELIKMYNW